MDIENNPDKEPVVTREHVVEVLRTLEEKFNAGDPAALPLDEPEVIAAESLVDARYSPLHQELQGSSSLAEELLLNLDRSTIYTDAGFADPNYIDEVANEWLAQDQQAAQDAGLVEIAQKIQEKRTELNKLLPEGE